MKAGVMLMDLSDQRVIQADLWSSEKAQDKQADRLMETLDMINAKLGRHSLTFAGALNKEGWKMKQGNLSARFTTEWSELPMVRA